MGGRLVYSPETDMTEDFMRQGARQLQARARVRVMRQGARQMQARARAGDV